MWSRGDVVALRDLWLGNVWRAVAGVVVEDTLHVVVFWIPAGSASSYPIDAEGREIRLPRPDFERGTRRTTVPMVVVCDERAAWTIWLFFQEGGLFDHWYVNFERYLGRSTDAYDSVDHKLDLIVRPGDQLEWKDEAELDEAGRHGLLDVAEIRRDAERVLAEHPWPTGWEGFEPDPTWPVPELPDGSDVV